MRNKPIKRKYDVVGRRSGRSEWFLEVRKRQQNQLEQTADIAHRNIQKLF